MTRNHVRERRPAGPILCALDESPPSDAALRVASSLAQALARPLHVVHVWAGVTAAIRERDARRFLREVVSDVTVEGSHFETDAAADGIVTAAERIDAGLVVMGTHSRGRFGRFLLGSTATDVLDRARWPLLIVRPETGWPPARIVVGEDGSEAAGRAGELAAEISAAYAARITLLEAVPELVMLSDRQDPRGAKATAIVKRTQSHLDQRAAALAAIGGHPPGTTMRLARPERALVDATKPDASTLLVVGHRTGGAHAGSIAESLVLSTHAPILIFSEDALAS